MKKILIGAAMLVALLLLAFFAFSNYIYQEKQMGSNEPTNTHQTELVLGDEVPTQGTTRTDAAPASSDMIAISNIDGTSVTFLITANVSAACRAREYKIDYGDGKNDWLQVRDGVCTTETSVHTHTYDSDREGSSFTARLHDLTDITYHEPAFSEIENPVSSVEVKISK